MSHHSLRNIVRCGRRIGIINYFTGGCSSMLHDRLRYSRFPERLNFFLVAATFGFILLAAGTSFGGVLDDKDISENIWASELAPVFDYGLFNERFIAMRSKEEPRGMSPMQTPPPTLEEEGSTDPKPHKPPDRPGIPVDPSYLDQPLACTAPVVDVSTRSGNEDETFVVVNPTNTQNIVAFSNQSGNSIYKSYTTNGGASWTHGTVATNAACCDGQAVWDSFGNLFLVYLNASVSQVNLIVSTNGGATFGAPITVGTGPSGTVDQPSIAVGSGSVWVDWNNNGDNNGDMLARGAPITGLGGLGAFGALQTIPGGTGTYGGIAVGPGGKVILTYMAPELTQGPATIYCNTDADGLGPGGFGARVTVTATNVGGYDYIPAQSGRSVDAEAGVVWDATGGAFNNRIYLVYTDETVNENNDTDILMRTSDDDGASWSAPVRVNDDATTRSQFNPYIALDRTTGTVAVGFHDARNDNGTVGAGGTNTTPNDDAEYWATYTTNGGASFAPNVRLSGGWSNAAAAGASTDYGDYEGQAAESGKFYAVWADNANCDGTNPNGTAHQFDLVMGTLQLPGGSSTPTATATNTSTNTPTPTNTPTATPTEVASISGTVRYVNASSTPESVSNVLISGAGSPNVSTFTLGPGSVATGQYFLTGFGQGPYTVTPSKVGGANGITSFDAAKVAQHVAGITTLNANQQIAGDASGNGQISSFDAAEIAQYVVNGAGGHTTEWKFLPANRPYPSVTTPITGEDYSAILVGEVSGNWTNTGARNPGDELISDNGASDIYVTLSNLVSPVDKEIVVPINVEGIADKGVISYEFDLRYDPLVIQPQETAVETSGTVSRGLIAAAKADEPGLLRVAVYGAMPMDGDGLLLNLRFTAVGKPGSVSPLTWERIMFNEGDSLTLTENGQVELSAAAPDQAEINGRVLTPFGSGVPNARVTLTDTAGQTRTTVSNGFGYYRSGDLQIGQTFTIRVESRSWRFTPLMVSLSSESVSMDMIAGE